MPIPKPGDDPTNNRILAALPESELDKLREELEHAELEADQVLWEPDEEADYLYFPTTSLISLVYENDAGSSISIATLGRSGVAGIGLITGNVRTPDKAVVLYGGSSYRMKASRVENELKECGDFHALLVTYTHSLLVHISQNAICNRLHRIERQLCRWLLDCRDELQTDVLSVTHDQIASLLGVRRESISLAAAQLQKRKLIKTNRGKIRILDAEGIRSAACECYAIVNDHLNQALKEYSAEH